MTDRVAVVGATGQLGRHLVQVFTDAGVEVVALARPDFDVTRADHLKRLTELRPDTVINAAAWTDVDGCARDPARANAVNGHAAGALAAAAHHVGARFVQISTNEVFDGTLDRPYQEDDLPKPINPYGESKLLGERLVAESVPSHLIVRTAWLFAGGGPDFPTKILSVATQRLVDGRPLRVVGDEWGNPTPVPLLAMALRRLVQLQAAGIATARTYHLAGTPPISRFDWAQRLLAHLPLDVERISLDEYRRASRPPARAILETSRVERLGLRLEWIGHS